MKGTISDQNNALKVLDFSSDIFLGQSSLGIYCARNLHNLSYVIGYSLIKFNRKK